MGNRGTVVFTDGKGNYSCAVYLHWNGSAESIYPFLEELDRRKARCDQDYEVARFVQLVGDFFDSDEIGSTSLGLVNGPKSDSPYDLDKIKTDHSDNGLYLVRRTEGKLVMRRFTEKYDADYNGRALLNGHRQTLTLSARKLRSQNTRLKFQRRSKGFRASGN